MLEADLKVYFECNSSFCRYNAETTDSLGWMSVATLNPKPKSLVLKPSDNWFPFPRMLMVM